MEATLAFILGIVIFVVGLGLSIALHELGHLIPAKRFNVKVTQYMVGFGPTLFSRRRGETEYGIKAIPFGGYIRMIGMYLPRKGESEDTIRNDSTGFAQQLSRDGETLGGEVIGPEDRHRTFVGLAWYKKIVIMLSGPLMNFVLAVVFTMFALVGIGTPQLTNQNLVGSVSQCVITETGSASTTSGCTAESTPAPALAAGIQPGDRIVSINAVPVTEFSDISAVVKPLGGQTVPIVVERNGERLTLSITPVQFTRPTSAEPNAPLETSGFLGVGAYFDYVRSSPGEVTSIMWMQFSATAESIINLPHRMVDVAQTTFSGEDRDPNGPIGIVGVARFSGEIVQAEVPGFDTKEKAATILQVLASLNMALFAFNLVPLLPLDGGHVLAAVIDGVRGVFAKMRRRAAPRPFDISRLMPLTVVVFLLIASMSVMLVIADVFNPISLFG
ncbi:site-2 protease family protein [Micrococcales bacterium 31B]|nr:site-2 protease family protein [Micrococcales bacterium 31B]